MERVLRDGYALASKMEDLDEAMKLLETFEGSGKEGQA